MSYTEGEVHIILENLLIPIVSARPDVRLSVIDLNKAAVGWISVCKVPHNCRGANQRKNVP
jgi:hypothetical protein